MSQANSPSSHKDSLATESTEATAREIARNLAESAAELYCSTDRWIEWMDSDGDGTEITLDDEDAMVDRMREALMAFERAAGLPVLKRRVTMKGTRR
jgi:hypothetical protein